MQMYSVDFRLGQALVNATAPEKAKEYSEQEWGRSNGPYKVTPATKSDEEWVKSMGGIVHEAH